MNHKMEKRHGKGYVTPTILLNFRVLVLRSTYLLIPYKQLLAQKYLVNSKDTEKVQEICLVKFY